MDLQGVVQGDGDIARLATAFAETVVFIRFEGSSVALRCESPPYRSAFKVLPDIKPALVQLATKWGVRRPSCPIEALPRLLANSEVHILNVLHFL